ncbi:MAG: hypothetical protein LBU34_01975 [Planctomycetaceae bacterium]|jgi:hypothetical protein|nr:hypothetical protein [Planctomycetaceae bacterium]
MFKITKIGEKHGNFGLKFLESAEFIENIFSAIEFMNVKKFNLLMGFLCVVIFICLLLSGIQEHRRTIIEKNVESSSIVFGGTPAFSSIYTSRIKYERTFEAVISEGEFLKYCQQNNWAVESFCNPDTPLIFVRYNWVESTNGREDWGEWVSSTNKYFNPQETPDIDQEKGNSYFHFISHGYLYDNLHGEKNPKGLRILIVYDKSNGKVYAYYRTR